MNEMLTFLLLVVVVGVPALLIARSARRLGGGAQRNHGLSMWSELRGWRFIGSDDGRLGRWQIAPFTALERITTEVVVGEFRGRAASSLRLETAPGADGPWQIFHVLTVELREPSPVRQLRLEPADAAPVGRPSGPARRSASAPPRQHMGQHMGQRMSGGGGRAGAAEGASVGERPGAGAAEGGAMVASAREPAALVERLTREDAGGLSVRVEQGTVVGWLSGVPVLAELDDRLEVLTDVAELLEAG